VSLPAVAVIPAGTGLAAGLTLVLTEPARRVALRLGLTDRPAPHKAHRRPTPYLGGVALAVGCLLPVTVLARGWNLPLVTIVVAGVCVAGLGLADDVLSLSKRTRLGVEALAAVAVTLAVRAPALVGVRWLDTLITVGWIVVITNSFNLLDNMDAAAASVGTATAGVLGVAALLAGQGAIAVLLLCLAGGCAGFLAHNRPPARIFMGDAGSLFIGFVLACAVLPCLPAGRGNAYAVLLLATFVATVDTTVVVIHRRRTGRPWHHGGTDHVSHRLHRLGLRVGRVAVVLFVVAAGSTALGTLVLAGVLPGWPTFGAAVLGAAAAVALLLAVPIPEPSREPVSEPVPEPSRRSGPS
jgi:UDP-GlcNAc:undecaprenyl-phosphate GlcNAc-1-phosphate transferase